MIENYIARLPGVLHANEQLVRRGRYLSTTFLLQSGSDPYYISLRQGKIHEVATGPQLLKSWTFALKASHNAWLKHWLSYPPPGWQDIFAMEKIGEATVEGDLYPLMSNLRYIKELIALPRDMKGEQRGQ